MRFKNLRAGRRADEPTGRLARDERRRQHRRRQPQNPKTPTKTKILLEFNLQMILISSMFL